MLYIVGLGPGNKDNMTFKAVQALKEAQVIVGYTTYIKLIEDLIQGKEVVSTGMTGEVDRCKKAISLAQAGKDVALVSSGDAGIYGMAGLVLEILESQGQDLDLEIIPGVTASVAGAGLLGAPLMNDFCQISLSDLLTPWEVIEKRLLAAAQADFVICLYNPRSKGRPDNLRRALGLISPYKEPYTPIGICKDVGREEEKTIITSLGDLDEGLEAQVDMRTVVIIGNKHTRTYKGYMYTQRGYDL